MSFLIKLLASQQKLPQIPKGTNFDGQTILITGATSGLGLETAIHFVRLGASRVIITARNADRGKKAQAAIEESAGKKGVVEVRTLDMDTLSAIKPFVDGLKDVEEVDYVLLNAGVHPFSFQQSPDDWEETLQVNMLSTTLLALLILPWMKRAKPASRLQHLGVVTSGNHTNDFGKAFPKKNVLAFYNNPRHYPGAIPMYGISKLLMMDCMIEIEKLAKLDTGSPPVIVNPMCPGMCKSNLAREANIFLQVLAKMLFAVVAKSGEEGARTMVLAAMTKPEESGNFIKHYGRDEEYRQQAAKIFDSTEGKERHANVWKETCDIMVKKVPELKDIIHAYR